VNATQEFLFVDPGSPEVLQECGVEAVANYPSVGEDLQDSIGLSASYKTARSVAAVT
jgi:hypothetical protein